MTVSARFEERHAFVLQPQDAKKLWSILEDRFGCPEGSALCVDGIERTFPSADAVNSYENARGRAIVSMKVSAYSKDYDRRAEIYFGARYSSSIEGSLHGPEDLVIATKNSLGEIFDGMRPWYSAVSRVDFFHVIFTVFMLSLTVIVTMAAGSSSSGSSPTFQHAVFSTSVVTILFAIIAGIIWLLNRLRRRFFPIAVFAVGQGGARHSIDEKIRWGVIVGLITSLVATLLGALISQ